MGDGRVVPVRGRPGRGRPHRPRPRAGPRPPRALRRGPGRGRTADGRSVMSTNHDADPVPTSPGPCFDVAPYQAEGGFTGMGVGVCLIATAAVAIGLGLTVSYLDAW